MRPSDLASEHGLSTQAVRNYERDGFLPPAERTANGYRIFTEPHALALRAFLALVPAHGHAAAGEIMLATGYRRFDVRDAELAHLLRRGQYPLGRIARIVRQVRDAGVVDLEDWQDRLTARGLAMLDAAGRLSDYLRPSEERGDLKRAPGRARPRSPGR